MSIPKHKPDRISLAAWIDFTIGNGATIVISRHGTTDLILPDDAPGWLTEISFNEIVRASSFQKPFPYLSRILSATMGVLATARRLGISEKEVKRRLATGELGGVKLGSEWRASVANIERLLAGAAE